MNIYYEKPAKKRKTSTFAVDSFPIILWCLLFGWVVLRSFPELF